MPYPPPPSLVAKGPFLVFNSLNKALKKLGFLSSSALHPPPLLVAMPRKKKSFFAASLIS